MVYDFLSYDDFNAEQAEAEFDAFEATQTSSVDTDIEHVIVAVDGSAIWRNGIKYVPEGNPSECDCDECK